MRCSVCERGRWVLLGVGVIGLMAIMTQFAAAAEVPVQSVDASADDGNEPANAIDGDLGNRWSAEGDGQWIRFDLGEARMVSEIDIAWYRGTQRSSAFDVQVSMDGSDWTTVFSGESSGEEGDFERYALEATEGRYVRVVGHGNSWPGNDWNSINEVVIHASGSGDAPDVPGGELLPVASVEASADDGNVPANTLDGDLETRWSAEGDGEWIQYDLGETRQVGRVAIAWFRGTQRTTSFDVLSSPDGSDWSTVFTGRSSGETDELELFELEPSEARYVRIVGHGNSWPNNEWNSINEIQFIKGEGGSSNEAPVAVDDRFSVKAGSTLQVNGVLDNDTDADGDSLTAVRAGSPSNGSLALNSDGSFTYSPDAGFAGTDSFTYMASDGTDESAPATVMITVEAIDHNTPLEVSSVSASADDGNVAANVLDGDLGTRWSAEGQGEHITFDLGDERSVREVGVAWYRGDERRSSFEIQTSGDGSNWRTAFTGESSGTTLQAERYDITDADARYVRIVGYGNSWQGNDWNSITEVDIYSEEAPDEPDAPLSSDDSYSIEAGTELTVGPNNGVLENDIDEDGDSLVAELISNPGHGTLSFSESGAFSYMPDEEFTGTDTFTYQASDGELTSSIATVAITVRPAGGSDPDDGGWTEFNRSNDTRVIYVSSSEGDNANDGRSPDRPVRTLAAGYSRLRNGSPDWMLLKCGDTWNEGINRWMKGGRSESEPMLLASYGQGPRPVIRDGIEVHSGTGDRTVVEYLAFVDIGFIADPDDQPDQGFRWRGNGGHFLIEGCRFEYNRSNIIIIRRDGELYDFSIRRNVVANAFTPGDGYSQGMFAANIQGMVIEENVFDNNGWESARVGGDGNVEGQASVFNHNNYLPNIDDLVIRNNVYANGSGLGIKLAGERGKNAENFTIRNNLFVDNGYGVSLNSNNYGDYIHRDFLIERNVFSLMGHDYDRGYRAKGIVMLSTSNGTIQDNYIIRKRESGGGQAMVVDDNPHRNLLIQRNVIFKWQTNNPDKLIWVQEPSSEITERSNQENLGADRYFDASRSTATYNASIGGDESADAFLREARRLRKGFYRPEYTAKPVVDHISEGFTLLPTRD